MCLTYYDRTTKTCHILSKNLSIVLKLLSDDRAAPTELSILVAIRLFISFPVSQYKFFLHFNQSHSPFTSASYINIKMKRAKKKLCSKFTDDFTRLFVMPLGTCRAVHFRFDSFFFLMISTWIAVNQMAYTHIEYSFSVFSRLICKRNHGESNRI